MNRLRLCLLSALLTACSVSATGFVHPGAPDADVDGPAAPPVAPIAPDAAAEGGEIGAADAAVVTGTVDAAPPPAPTLTFALAGVATWRGGADAAYSLVHDRVCDPVAQGAFAHADPELARRALHAGFAVQVGSCGSAEWPQVMALAAHGHDILNDSWSHRCLGTAGECGARESTSDLSVEIDESSRALQDNLGRTAQYFVFPYDVCGAGAVGHLKQIGYLGARCGGAGISQTQLPDPFATRADGWGPGHSIYAAAGPCAAVAAGDDGPPAATSAACRTYVLTQYVEDTLKQRGWGIQALGGFDDDVPNGAQQPISVADYVAHLEYLRGKIAAGKLWVEGPTPVLKYRFARELCAPPAVVAGVTLHFPAPSAECARYAGPLTYVVTSAGPAPAGLRVTQAGVPAAVRQVAPGRLLLDADPTKGDAEIGLD